MSRPEQLTSAFVRSGTERGALVADYACAEGFTSSGGQVLSVAIRDCQSGGFQEVAANQFILAAGPWTGDLLALASGSATAGGKWPRHALALNLVVGRRLADAAIGVRSERSATEDPLGGGRRFLFLVPQEETTLVGTWYGTVEEEGAVNAALEQGRLTLLEDVRRACPRLGLTPADIVGLHWGWLPLDIADGRTARLADRPQVAGPTDLGFANLHAVETVKYTTARGVAERVLDRVVGTLPGAVGPCRTAEEPLAGAGLGDVP